jgi:hypothetical protein
MNTNVFINCPFTEDYRDKFEALVFCVIRAGYTPRCARELDDAGEVRYEKICRIIADCSFGIHDISKADLDENTGLARFNMPLELGLFLGAAKFGPDAQQRKRTLIMDSERYRYQSFMSDIAGQDIQAHANNTQRVVEIVATWLRQFGQSPPAPGGQIMAREFDNFVIDLPAMASSVRLSEDELTFLDLSKLCTEWIAQN